MSSKDKKKNNKVSIFGEMGMMSITAIVCMIAVVLGCVAFYLFMSSSPKKHVIVDDDAVIFTNAEENELERLASSLSTEEDINAVIVTTRDKGRGYTNSDEDCARYAGDYYADKCIKTSLVNNSGICIFIDLTIEGIKFFKQFVIVKFKDYDSINDIEKYKGRSIYVTRENAVKLSADEYFIADLIGMEVVDEEGGRIGELKDVMETGANDVYVIKRDEGDELLLPAIKQCILSVDTADNVMKVHVLKGL